MLTRRARSFGLDLMRPHYVIAIKAAPVAGDGEMQVLHDRMYEVLKRAVAGEGFLGEYDGCAVAIFPQLSRNARDEALARAAQLVEQVRSLLGRGTFTAGVGGAYAGVEGVRRATGKRAGRWTLPSACGVQGAWRTSMTWACMPCSMLRSAPKSWSVSWRASVFLWNTTASTGPSWCVPSRPSSRATVASAVWQACCTLANRDGPPGRRVPAVPPAGAQGSPPGRVAARSAGPFGSYCLIPLVLCLGALHETPSVSPRNRPGLCALAPKREPPSGR